QNVDVWLSRCEPAVYAQLMAWMRDDDRAPLRALENSHRGCDEPFSFYSRRPASRNAWPRVDDHRNGPVVVPADQIRSAVAVHIGNDERIDRATGIDPPLLSEVAVAITSPPVD